MEHNKFIPDEKPDAKLVENCPHCGIKLSRWEQVLLNVDRALMCKNCWYRIILEAYDENKTKSKGSNS